EEAYWKFILEKQPGKGASIPRELDPEPCRQRHATFDWLSGATPGTSTPEDLIRDGVFDMLEARLGKLDSVVEHVHVQIAHAATEFSRTGRVMQRWNLDDARGVIKVLTQIAQAVGEW